MNEGIFLNQKVLSSLGSIALGAHTVGVHAGPAAASQIRALPLPLPDLPKVLNQAIYPKSYFESLFDLEYIPPLATFASSALARKLPQRSEVKFLAETLDFKLFTLDIHGGITDVASSALPYMEQIEE